MLNSLEPRQAVIQTALSLYARHGYDNVPIREVAFEASVAEAEIRAMFPTKEKLLDAVIEFIPTVIVHYVPTREDLVELLREETPAEILSRFVTYYNLDNELLYGDIYRFIFREQYRNRAIGEMGYSKVIGPPRENAARAIEMLVELGAVPPCDGAVIADVWGRTSLMYCMLAAHEGVEVERREYLDMTRFFIDMVVRGVDVLPLENVEVNWSPAPLRDTLDRQAPGLRGEIMVKAVEVFGERGYARTTMQGLADALEMPIVDLYGVFRSKEEIMSALEEVLHQSHDQLVESPAFDAVLREGDPKAIILFLADSHAGGKSDLLLQFYRIVYREQFENDQLKNYLISSFYLDIASVSKQLDQFVRQGRIPPCPSWKVATAFIHTMRAYAMDATVFPREDPEARNRGRLSAIALLSSFVVNGYRLPETP